MKRALALAAALGASVACNKDHDAAPPAASSVPEVRAPAPPPELTTLPAAVTAADVRVEARRGTLAGMDPLLERHKEALEKHFGGKVPFPLAFQVVSLGARGSAVLLQATAGESRPLAWAQGADGAMLWAKENPLGGVKPGASEASLAGGPDGHVCIAWCNESSSSVALRRWSEDGGAFADYEAFHFDACDALSTLYWPKHGWLLGAAYRNGSIVQLINENGVHVFGADGMSLPWLSRATSPVAFGLDTEQSFLFFRVGRSGGDDSPEYAFAHRFDPAGKPIWPGPLSVKRLTTLKDPSARITLLPGTEGGVRATLYGAAVGKDVADVEVLSDGSVRRR